MYVFIYKLSFFEREQTIRFHLFSHPRNGFDGGKIDLLSLLNKPQASVNPSIRRSVAIMAEWSRLLQARRP